MKTRGIALLPLAALALAAQTVQLTGPDGKPVVGPDGKPATMTMTAEAPEAGPALSSLPPETVVLAVGPEKITAAELDRIIEILPEQARAAARGAGRRKFAEDLVRMKLLAQEARKRKVDQSPQYVTQSAFQAENLLAALLFQEIDRKSVV